MLGDPREHLHETFDEARDRVRRPVLERAEIDEQPDRGVVRPVVRTPEHLGLDHLQVGREWTLVRDRLVLRPPAVRSRAGPAVAHSEASRSTPGTSASSVRPRRSNQDPSGSECTTAPEIKIGRWPLAWWASVSTREPSSTVTAPLPTTSIVRSA